MNIQRIFINLFYFCWATWSLNAMTDNARVDNTFEHQRISYDEFLNSCGVNSCYIVSRMLNKEVDYSYIHKKLLPIKNSKVSIAQLEQILGEYKIRTNTLKLRPTQLYENPNCLFIMYTRPPKDSEIGHFSVVRVIDENRIQIIDPPYPSKILKKTDWGANDKIIFTAVGDNFKTPSKFTLLNIVTLVMIIVGITLIAYEKFSKYKRPK